MNDDLISREALKKAIEENGCRHSHYFDIFDVIDNAPTVEYTFEEAFQKTVCDQRLYCPARPTGEWLEFKGGYYKCDNCGEVERAKKNYCCNCGAYMRKGEAE